MTVRVRPIAAADFDRWLPLWTAYNAFYERVLPDDITRATWSRFFDATEPVNALVAERARADGRDSGSEAAPAPDIIGIVHYLFHRSTSMLQPTCYLQDLYTLETMRGQGIGRALIEAVYAKAKEFGAGRVYWQTHETNTIAQRLYDRIADRSGFIVYRKLL